MVDVASSCRAAVHRSLIHNMRALIPTLAALVSIATGWVRLRAWQRKKVREQDEQAQHVCRLRLSGLSYKHIAEQVGITEQEARDIVNERLKGDDDGES